MISTPIQCDFCEELSGSSRNSFGQIYNGDPESRVLFGSEQFAVMPSLGQIIEGYLLIVPRRHWKAIGDLSAADVNELAVALHRVGEVLIKEYGPFVLFEHGTRSESVGGCGIYHAHLHATPLGTISDPVAALKLKFPYEELSELAEINDRTAGLSSYLFYRDSDGRFYIFNTGPLPSQYMRQLIAEAMGEQVWNWRAAGREDRLLATMRRLSGRLDWTKSRCSTPAQWDPRVV
jgi:diadenosine tetraphosphate (Ap4A) HIT family hydrolase